MRSRLVQAAVDGGAAGGSSACAAVLATLKMRSNDVEDTHLCKNQARQLCKGGRAGLRLNTLCCPVCCARVRGSALCGTAQYRRTPFAAAAKSVAHNAARRVARTIARQPHVSPHAATGRRAAMPTVQCTKHPSLKNAHIESVRSREYSVQKSRCMKNQVCPLAFSLCNPLVFLLHLF